MLEILTFTGVDQQTSISELASISRDHPKVEFGMLAGTQSGETPIFPAIDFIRTLSVILRKLEVRQSLHLCGILARAAAGAPAAPVHTSMILDLCQPFDRVQVNLHGDSPDDSRIDVNAGSLTRFADMVACKKVILQHREDWESVPIPHQKVEYLFDRSEGRGIESFDAWPAPAGPRRVGYSGGIGPDNIGRAMQFVEKYPDTPMWLDMEGRIRTGGWFDTGKARAVCERAFPKPHDPQAAPDGR